MDCKEVLLTSSRYAQQWSCALWDLTTGSMLHCYKNGGVVAGKSLIFVGEDYLLAADEDKPKTHVWPLNSQEPMKKFSTILPEKATALAICPNSVYLAIGIGVKLYVWHLPSGRLLTIQKKNFQPISCIKFSSDGVFILISGEDGMLIVYDLISLLSFQKNYLPQSEIGQVDPVFTKQDHTMPIADFHVGILGFRSRIATVSSDNTCKLYELSTGEMVLSLVFEEPLSAVVFDNVCWNLFVGAHSGKIQQFCLKEPPRPLEHHVGGEDLVFKGHKNRVTCLCLSVLASVLVSGSEDNFVYIWDISSRQILKAIEHKGALTNVTLVFNYDNFFAQHLKPKCVVKALDRDLNDDDEFVECKRQDYDIELSDDEFDLSQGQSTGEKDSLRQENTRLKAANKQLYDVGLEMSKKFNGFPK